MSHGGRVAPGYMGPSVQDQYGDRSCSGARQGDMPCPRWPFVASTVLEPSPAAPLRRPLPSLTSSAIALVAPAAWSDGSSDSGGDDSLADEVAAAAFEAGMMD